jgi:hypothetical protein
MLNPHGYIALKTNGALFGVGFTDSHGKRQNFKKGAGWAKIIGLRRLGMNSREQQGPP